MRSSLLERSDRALPRRLQQRADARSAGDRRRARLARRRRVADPGARAQRPPSPADGAPGGRARRARRNLGWRRSCRSGTAAARRDRATAGWQPPSRRASATGPEPARVQAASGAGAAGGGATSGTVTEVTAKTLYLTTSTGALVKVRLTKATTYTRTAKSPKGGLALGDTAIVIGSKNASGVLVATSVIATQKGVTRDPRGFGGGFGGGSAAARPPAAESSFAVSPRRRDAGDVCRRWISHPELVGARRHAHLRARPSRLGGGALR